MASPQVSGGCLTGWVRSPESAERGSGDGSAPAGTRLAPLWRIPRPAGAPASARGARIGPGGRDPLEQHSASSSAAALSDRAGQAPASSATSATPLERGQLGDGIRSASSATSARPGTARGAQSVPERGCRWRGRSPVPGSAGVAAAGTAAAAGRFAGDPLEPLEPVGAGQLGDVDGQAANQPRGGRSQDVASAAERRSAGAGPVIGGHLERRDPLCRDRAPAPPGTPAAPRGLPATCPGPAARTAADRLLTAAPHRPSRPSPDRSARPPGAPLERPCKITTHRTAPLTAAPIPRGGIGRSEVSPSMLTGHIWPSDHQHTYTSDHMGRCTYAHALTSAYIDSTAAQMRRRLHH